MKTMQLQPRPGAPAAPKDDTGNGFLAVLQQKERRDGTLSELNEKLGEAALGAAATGKKASVTLVLEAIPKNGALHFAAKIKTSIPQPEENLCLFYVDEEGQLSREDPNQQELPLRAVAGGQAEPAQPAAQSAS